MKLKANDYWLSLLKICFKYSAKNGGLERNDTKLALYTYLHTVAQSLQFSL